MQNCGVYALVFHTDAGEKLYIGSTVQPFQNRLRNHLCELRHYRHRNRYLQHLWNKYGKVEFRMLEVCPEMQETDLRLREQYWIENTSPSKLLNFGPAVPSPIFGKKHSDVTLAKISQASKRNWADPEYRAKQHAALVLKFQKPEIHENMSRAHKGKPLSPRNKAAVIAALRTPAVRAKISQASKRNWADPEFRARHSVAQSAALKGVPFSPEHKAALSKARKGKPYSPEHRASHVTAMGRPEVREKISQAARRNWIDPEYREKNLKALKAMSKAHLGVPLTAEHKAAISAGRQTPEAREKIRRASKRNWADPEYREKTLKGIKNYQPIEEAGEQNG